MLHSDLWKGKKLKSKRIIKVKAKQWTRLEFEIQNNHGKKGSDHYIGVTVDLLRKSNVFECISWQEYNWTI